MLIPINYSFRGMRPGGADYVITENKPLRVKSNGVWDVRIIVAPVNKKIHETQNEMIPSLSIELVVDCGRNVFFTPELKLIKAINRKVVENEAPKFLKIYFTKEFEERYLSLVMIKHTSLTERVNYAGKSFCGGFNDVDLGFVENGWFAKLIRKIFEC